LCTCFCLYQNTQFESSLATVSLPQTWVGMTQILICVNPSQQNRKDILSFLFLFGKRAEQT
jgi:hypothetical protein